MSKSDRCNSKAYGTEMIDLDARRQPPHILDTLLSLKLRHIRNDAPFDMPTVEGVSNAEQMERAAGVWVDPHSYRDSPGQTVETDCGN